MPQPKWVFGSDHGLSGDATGAPAILLEDSRPAKFLTEGLHLVISILDFLVVKSTIQKSFLKGFLDYNTKASQNELIFR